MEIADPNNGMVTLEVVHSVLDRIDQAALVVSAEGDMLFANCVFLESLGKTKEEVLGRKVYDETIGVTTKDNFDRTLAEARANGGRLTYERNQVVGGRHTYAEVTIVDLGEADYGHILYTSKDITELRVSQLRAEELNLMLNKIIDNLPVYLFVKDVDDDLRYLIWNKAFAESAKIPAEKVIGKTDFEIFPEYRDAQEFREDDLRVIENGEMTSKHETYMAADGTTRVVQTYKTLVYRQGRGPLLVGISLDITDIEGIEQELVNARMRAEASDRLKSRFLANMSHEIRTPLNAIVGFAGLLPEAEEDERDQFLHIINENCDQLLQIIGDILDLSKIEAGAIEYTRRPMDLHHTCEDVLLTYKDRVQPGVELIFDNEVNPGELIVNEDRTRLMQVLSNLINNAIKFTAEGEIHFGYNLKKDWIEMYVSDSGCGIPDDKQEEVFERFVKLDNFKAGTGLGLSICKQIVTTLGGKITVHSEEGLGSTFVFTLPYKSSDVNADEMEMQAVPIRHHGASNETILVAEDVMSNFLVVKALVKNRYHIIWAQNGKEAVEMARQEKPDLVLMDIKMPIMDGLEATSEIRKFDEDVPIVALTAYAYDNDRARAMHAGMNNFLSKPINRDAFEAVLNAYLTPPILANKLKNNAL